MNRLFTTALLTAAACVFLAPFTASAATIVYEPFAYANGNLVGNTNPTAPSTLNGFPDTNKWTATGTGNVTVIDGDLTYPNLPTTPTTHMARIINTNGNPVRIGIGEYKMGSPQSTIYFSMLLQVPSGVTTFGSSTTTGSFFSGLQFQPTTGALNGMNATSATAAGVMTIRADPVDPTGGYNLGIAFRDAPAATTRIFNATKFTAGQTVFLVGKLEMGTTTTDDRATLYLNPNPQGGEPLIPSAVSANFAGSGNNDIGTGVDAPAPPTLRSFFLRANSVEPSMMNIDEIRIGPTWSSVIPEPATIGMLAIAVAALLARRSRTP